MKKRLAQKQAAEVVQTRCASFTSRQIRSFEEIEFPDVAVSLDVSDNKIADFTGFEPKITLETLKIDKNPIVSFRGFPEQHMLLHFSAQQTPISELPNFRQLALLAIGTQLETINGVAVTQSELQAVSGFTLAGYFFRKTVTKMSEDQQSQITRQISDAIRHGYIASSFPRKISVISDAVNSQESDPITVRAMRLMHILRKDESTSKDLIKQLFCPVLPSKSTRKTQVVDERLAKQQSLINFMTDQLNQIKMERQQKIQQIEYQTEDVDYAENKKEFPVSDETKALYEKMVAKVAYELIQNSKDIEIEKEKEKLRDYWGLRNAVIRLLGVSDDLSDNELASLLRDQIEEVDYFNNDNNDNNDNNGNNDNNDNNGNNDNNDNNNSNDQQMDQL